MRRTVVGPRNSSADLFPWPPFGDGVGDGGSPLKTSRESGEVRPGVMEGHRTSGESFGEYLIRERKLRNIRLEEISHRTRISLKVLQALESNAREDLPSEVYVRGFLRAYARHVGLDENDLVLRYEDQAQRIQSTQREPVQPWKKRRVPVLRLVLVALAVGLLLGYWFWWRPAHRDAFVSAPQTAPEGSSVSPAPRPDLRPIPMPPPPPSGNGRSPGTVRDPG